MNVLTEYEAGMKICPILETRCHASGCMMWESGSDLIQTFEIPWPTEIPIPQFSEDPDRSQWENIFRMEAVFNHALYPLIGMRWHGCLIKNATCVNPHYPVVLNLAVKLEGEPKKTGYCRMKSPE